ncbi:hypothetical protein L3X38_041648 [Prunus dulcis]|uniref:Uncharacterized protein n=1 Tax=Prunus dulcis TaxID=3755 RepID=A0AAD4YKK1_PRUDU|nr:hypothetical protein L3X38_041648 [Prunus dulcis]
MSLPIGILTFILDFCLKILKVQYDNWLQSQMEASAIGYSTESGLFGNGAQWVVICLFLPCKEQKCHEINNEHKDLDFLTIPVGEKLLERLRGMNIRGDRLRLSSLSPPVLDLLRS